MPKLATIEKIASVEKHPNADSLDLVKVLNYICIVKRNEFGVGDKVVFIHPDTCLPEADWSAVYRSRSNRVKAIKLRGSWSFGIVEPISNHPLLHGGDLLDGTEVGAILGVTKYEPPAPQSLDAAGVMPFGLPKTDEEKYQALDVIPYGKIVDVSLKIDGQSFSVFAVNRGSGWVTGICSRSLLLKPECSNNYTRIAKKYDLVAKTLAYAQKHNINICLRGEIYGSGVQAMARNPHSSLPLDFALFSVYYVDGMKYAGKEDPNYFMNVGRELGIPTVPILESNVVLTPELIRKYDEELSEIDGKPFEGVVIKGDNFSFKVINKIYDSLK